MSVYPDPIRFLFILLLTFTLYLLSFDPDPNSYLPQTSYPYIRDRLVGHIRESFFFYEPSQVREIKNNRKQRTQSNFSLYIFKWICKKDIGGPVVDSKIFPFV